MQLSLALVSLLLSVAAGRVIPRAAALGALGGAAPGVQDSGDAKRPFLVNGNTFVNEAAAVQRSCDIQNNACFNAVNAGGAAFSQADCQAQTEACKAAGAGGAAGNAGAGDAAAGDAGAADANTGANDQAAGDAGAADAGAADAGADDAGTADAECASL